MRVYVTGIAGFIGSHVADLLWAAGADVWGCDDLSTGQRSNLPPDRRQIRWEEVGATALLSGVDVVVHLAALADTRGRPERYWMDTADAALMAVLAEKAGARFVFASSAAAARPRGHYGQAKRVAEGIATKCGGTVLRFANVYGPRSRGGVLHEWAQARRDGQPLRVDGDGSQTRDFIHVEDVAHAIFLATLSSRGDGQVLDICTGVQRSITDLATELVRPTVRGDRSPADLDVVVQSPDAAYELLGFQAVHAFDVELATR